jgi:predicted RNase H-like nuclease (RuvC/YqgF family)
MLTEVRAVSQQPTTHRRVCLLVVAVLAVGALTRAAAQQAENELDARLTAIESAIARLDTQLTLRTTPETGSMSGTDRSIESMRRIDTLERELAALTATIGRLERELDSVRREAAAATRQAAAAERAARDAVNRLR